MTSSDETPSGSGVPRPRSEPAWLVAAVDQRLALMREMIPLEAIGEHTIIVTPLAEPPENASARDIKRWENACDNCGQYRRNLKVYSTKRDLHGIPVEFTFGACERCLP